MQKKNSSEVKKSNETVRLILVLLLMPLILVVGLFLWGENNRRYADHLFQLLEENESLNNDNTTLEDVQLVLASPLFKRVDCSELRRLNDRQTIIWCLTPPYVDYNSDISNGIIMYLLGWSNYLIQFDFEENVFVKYTTSRLPIINP